MAAASGPDSPTLPQNSAKCQNTTLCAGVKLKMDEETGVVCPLAVSQPICITMQVTCHGAVVRTAHTTFSRAPIGFGGGWQNGAWHT